MEKEIGGSGGSLEPYGPLLTHLHTIYMAYSECLPTRLNLLAEKTCFSQVPQLAHTSEHDAWPRARRPRAHGGRRRGVGGRGGRGSTLRPVHVGHTMRLELSGPFLES